MPINFFDETCKEASIIDSEFGICDNEDGGKAFVDRVNRDKWVATVDNSGKMELIFTAIDNCVEILRDNGGMDKRCDGMLTSGDHIFFLELKNQRSNWKTVAIEQLRITVGHFIENHDISIFRYKKAFACNKKHPQFQVIDREKKQRFFDEFKVRLHVQATIKVT